MVSVDIRPAKPTDAAGIARVHVAAWIETYTGLIPDSMLAALDVDVRREMWDLLLSDDRSDLSTMTYVLETGSEMVGFGACGDQRSPELKSIGYDGEIGAIYILNAAHGYGLGHMLMQQMASYLLECGKNSVSLWVLSNNLSAQQFYARLGGVVVGGREEHRPQALLHEVAYGWADLRTLAA